ncbi:MAG: NADH-quinone oxidoreductase subunit C [Acidobacteria bacterium]|nr:NADH-quinone oxidoreductase subunit C [Acidobacteriota bacterium]
MTTTIDAVRRAVAGRPLLVTSVTTPRANELHCRVSPPNVKDVGDLACRVLGADLILMAADDRRRESGAFFVHYLFAHRADNWFLHASTRLEASAPELPSLARYHFPASRFEREIRDLLGIIVTDHPDPRPLVKHAFWPDQYYPLRKNVRPPEFADDGRPFPFTAVGGEGVYEIPVGRVMGETIIDMKSRLYFTHKGTEKLFERRDPVDGVDLAERVSGDTSVGHALAYCQAVEAAANVELPPRAGDLRVILLELERLYNHVADVGAIANDTGFAVAHAHCSRIREQLLRLNKALTESRLLRGVLCPGGLVRDLPVPVDLQARVEAAVADFDEVVEICLTNTLVLDRLEGTGVLKSELAKDHGVLGYVARASGLDIDVRRDHPFASYQHLKFSVPVFTAGDVKDRMNVRVEEVHESAALIQQACRRLSPGRTRASLGPIAPFAPAFGLVEGWRGRIVHWVMTSEDGRLHRVKIVDPSFFNWPALSQALVGNIVPDFPLCNKSFNQSYSGNDL